MVITGTATHFAQGATTASFGSGVTVNSLTVNSLTSATASITISATAATGTNAVTLTTGGEVATLANAFTIQPGTPALVSVNPNSSQQGQNLTSVIISSAFTHFVQGTTVASFGVGITVNSLTVTNATSATANITLGPTATTGPRTVTMTTGPEVVSLTNGFTLQTGPAAIASVAPNSGTQGQANVDVAITGTATHFAQGTTTASFGSGITVNTLTVTDATHATANITIQPTAPTGTNAVTLTTGGEVATLASAFTVQPGTATITTLSQNTGPQGQTISNIAITGAFTHFSSTAPATTASFGSGITVNTLTVTDATHAIANISISPTAATGPRTVTMTTGGEVATLNNGFTVQSGPAAIASVLPNSGQQGQTLGSVVITGTVTHFAQGTTTASFGSGVTVNSLTVNSATSATANITIQPTAATGTNAVTLTTGGEVAILANGFTVQAGTAVIFTVVPSSGQQGQANLNVAITGAFTHFSSTAPATTASFGSSDITVNTLTVTDATHATASISIMPTANTGARTVTMTTGTEVAALNNGFTVQSGPAAIASVVPNSGPQGQANLDVTITGTATHFAQGTTTASLGSGITVNTLTVTDATHATANITIQPTAPTGTNGVTLTTGGEVATLASAFTVQPGTATITTLSQNTGPQGQTLITVIITGAFTHFAQGTTVASFGSGITVNTLTVTDATHASANISISPTTATGPRTVTMTTGGEVATLNNGFTVQSGPAVIASVAPNSGQQGQTLSSVVITGTATHFAQGTTTASFGSGITVNSLTVNSAISATANITIQPTAATGANAVTLTTGGEVATLANAFTLQSGPAVIASVAPNSGQQGQTLSSVVITGTATHFAQGTTTASFGSGITVNTLTVNSATSATANLTISATAATGTNAVTLTTGGEVATLANAFTIQPGTPALVSVSPNSGQQGQTLTSVIITGAFTHFVQGTTVASFGGTDITINSLTVTDATHASANITISATAATGARTVTMTTGAEVATLNNGFTVHLAGVNNAQLNGHYVFVLRGFDPGGHAIAIAGSFIADGLGNITGGAMDINSFSSGPSTNLIVNPVASFYTIGADERGMLTLNTSDGVTRTFDFAVGPITSGVASAGHIVSRQNTSASNGSTISGGFNQQSTAAFSLSTSAGIGGDFAFGFEGADGGGNRTAGAGRLTINSNAMLTLGNIDINDNGTFDNGTAGPLTFSGSVDGISPFIDSNGRGTMTINITSGPTLHQAFYVGNANFLFIVSTDPVDANHSLYASGASRQSTSFCPSTGGCAFNDTALSGKAVVYLQGNSSAVTGGSTVQVGSLQFFSAPTNGSFNGGFDKNDAGVISTPSTNPVSGNFSIAPNGRVTLTNAGTNPPILYMVGVNTATLVGTNGSRVESGSAEPQMFNAGTAPIAFQMVSRSFGANSPAVSGTQAFTGVQMVTNVPNNCGQTGTLSGTTEDANSIAGGLQEDVAVANDNITLDTTTGRITFASAAQVGYWINRNRRAAINIQTTVTAPWISLSDNQSTITTTCVVLP